MPDIFVSYKSEDRDWVARLVETLESQGWDVWWDEAILPGDQWRPSIERSLEGARCVVVVWSTAAVESAFVRDEASRAGDRLVPVAMDPVSPPVGFGETQYADLSKWTPGTRHVELERFLKAVAQRLDASLDRAKLPPLRFPTAHALVGLAGLLLATGALWFVGRSDSLSKSELLLPVGIAAVVAGASVLSVLRGLAVQGIRVLRMPLVLAASAIVAAATFFGGFVSATGTRTVAIQFHGPAGADDCPPGVPGNVAIVSRGDRTKDIAIGDDCRIDYTLSRDAARTDAITVTLAPNEAFFVADRAERPLASGSIAVELSPVTTPRAELALLPYRGVESEGPSSQAFGVFQGILEDKIMNLSQELLVRPELADQQTLGELRLARIEADGEDGLGLRQKLGVWQQRHSLGLLTGTLTRDTAAAGDRFVVNSQVFIGDLDGLPNGRSVAVSMPVGPEQFRNTRDAHALVMLYALAMDARRLGLPPDVITAYLSAAFDIAATLPPEHELSAIAERVEQELDSMAAGATGT